MLAQYGEIIARCAILSQFLKSDEACVDPGLEHASRLQERVADIFQSQH